ncbi:MAG: trypsin-like peptidase domain-containing protein [Bacteroidota bacterium]
MPFATICARGSALVALLLLSLPPAAAQGGDAYRAEVFSTLDRRAVEVGGLVELSVEVLALPRSRSHGERLVAALGDTAPEASPDVDVVRSWPVSHRWREGVLEIQRRYVLRVRQTGEIEVPPVVLDVPRAQGRTVRLGSRPQPLRVFAAWPEAQVRSVVPIVAEGEVGERRFRRTGSAWLAAPDALVTAYHVVVGSSRVRAKLPSGRLVTLGRVWALDPERDIAVLHVDPRETERADMQALVVAPEGEPEAGAVAFTAGWPLVTGSVRDGYGFDRRQLRTAAAHFEGIGVQDGRLRVAGNAVRPGDSGGPLLDEQGRVLGVVVSGRSTNGEANLLREDVCLATDPVPALRARRDRPARLARALREAAEQDPAARAYAVATRLVGPIRVQTRDFTRDRAVLIEATQQAPRDATLQFLAGTVFEAIGDEVAAARAYRGAYAEGYFPAAYALAHHHLGASQPIRAAALFEEVRESAPYQHLGAMGHARALAELHRWPEAEQAIREVLDHDPRFAPALYLLAVAHLAQGREARAEALATRLSTQQQWASSLRLLLRHEVLRPSALQPLERADLGEVPMFER